MGTVADAPAPNGPSSAAGVALSPASDAQKYNQIRNFTKRGVEALVVPWDYDFSKEEYDGLFIRSVMR